MHGSLLLYLPRQNQNSEDTTHREPSLEWLIIVFVIQVATDWGVHNSIASRNDPGGASVTSKLELNVV
jgi:hypothetical protein